MDALQEKGLELIRDERQRQDAKWGVQRNLPRLLWLGILGEEFGEVAKASIECVATFEDDGELPPEQIVYGERELLEELVQTAAVAVAWIEDLLENGELNSLTDLPDAKNHEWIE